MGKENIEALAHLLRRAGFGLRPRPRALRLIVLGLVLLIGLSPSGREVASRYESDARLTVDFLERAIPSVTQSGQAEETVSLPEGASTGWWAAVQENLGRSEYQVTWQDRTYLPNVPAAYQAPNRAHNLRTYFTPAGLRVIPRTGDGAAWEWGLTLTGYGYGGAIQPVAPATLTVEGNRIEYRRGDLTEWYINDERGLEQGFTIAAPPVGASGGKGNNNLVLEMALTGDLTPTLTEDGRTVDLTTEGGVRVLRYGSLYAEDVTGRRLPAYLALTPSGTSVLVDDSSAVYVSAYVTFLSASSTQGGCVESAGTVTCNLGELASGATADVDVRVTVDPAQDFRRFSTSTVAATEVDPVPSNDVAIKAITVHPFAGFPGVSGWGLFVMTAALVGLVFAATRRRLVVERMRHQE